MTTRRLLIAGNWKMNLNVSEASILVHKLDKQIANHHNLEIVIGPSFLSLQSLRLEINHSKFKLASQNGYPIDEGHYTGEVSFAMQKGLVDYAIIGHSARRIYFHESLDDIKNKIKASIRNRIKPILCIGETKQERLDKETKQVLSDQIVSALYDLTSEEVATIAIAYEPIWAISTFDGEPSDPSDMQRELAFIRKQIADLYGQAVADEVRLLYGGTVDDDNALSYLSLDDCDGVLVGAASLNPDKFSKIVSKAYEYSLTKGDSNA